MVDVKGKWALVTGASRGLGYLSAKFMAERGCNLILHSRTLESSAKVLEEVKAFGIEAYAVAAELSDLAQVEAMLKEIDAKGTKVDIVLNNAGLQIAYRNEYLDTPMSDYDISFKVNTMAPMMICYHFIPQMVERGFGRIVNTSSGINLDPQQAGYSASKAALDKVTRDLGSKYEGTDVMINDKFYMPSNGVTLYAKWIVAGTSYIPNTNGGSAFSGSVKTGVDNTIVYIAYAVLAISVMTLIVCSLKKKREN